MRRLWLVLGLTLTLSSCEFGEVEIPEGDPMLVVLAVMRPDLDRQWILVEQTLTGMSAAEDSLPSVIPGDLPPMPVTSATVSVTNLSMVNDPCGATLFTETPGDPELRQSLGLYWGPLNCPTMRPGDSLQLRVETADGLVVTGRTEVVGAERTVLRLSADSVVVPGPILTLNRDVDTLEADVAALFGRSVQIEVSRPDSMNVLDPMFLMFLDTTAITIPGNLVNFLDAIFDDDDDSTSNDSPESIFTAGRYHTVTVALMDDHFFDYERTANMRLSGRGFVNHLEGGMGVFGSVVASANEVKVIGNLDDNREGGYRMTGLVDGIAVDISLELYVAAAGDDTTNMAAFVEGDWVLGNLDTSADGFFQDGTMALTVYQVDPIDPGFASAIFNSLSTHLYYHCTRCDQGHQGHTSGAHGFFKEYPTNNSGKNRRGLAHHSSLAHIIKARGQHHRPKTAIGHKCPDCTTRQ